MYSALYRSTSFVKATSVVVGSTVDGLVASIPKTVPNVRVVPLAPALTNQKLSNILNKNGLKATSAVAGPLQIRFAHTDLKFPDFDYYRPKETSDPNKYTDKEYEAKRNVKDYAVTAVGGAMVAIGAKNAIYKAIDTWNMRADSLALASIEVDLSTIPEGKNTIVKWRGKPLFIRHRTASEIETEKSVELESLRDPQIDADRVKNPKWLIVLGICTHLGCIPAANSGDFGGYFCPCHGSHYDLSGRIRKGPAPLNLEVPPYDFLDENTVKVG